MPFERAAASAAFQIRRLCDFGSGEQRIARGFQNWVSAKSLPARAGITDSTVVHTRLDPDSSGCMPSIPEYLGRGDDELALLTIIFQSTPRTSPQSPPEET
jgi:hypothetical protein